MATSPIITRAVDAWVNKEVTFEEEMDEYRRHTLLKLVFIAVCMVGVVLVAGYTLTIGDYPIGFWHSYEVLWDHLMGTIGDETEDFIVWKVRMPRIFTGILAGVGLAICGAVMQSILKNPLADSYTTGVSSGASFGATLAIAVGFSVVGYGGYAIVANAFVFSLIPVMVILGVAKMRGASPVTMIMAGIAIMYVFNATTTLIKLSVTEAKLASIFDWSVGSLDNSSWHQVYIMALFVIAGTVVMQLSARKLNVLSTGDESAKSIGINSNRLRMICMFVVSLMAASIVSFTGMIGFVGLVCPHIVRLLIGSDNRFLLPASAAFGAVLLTASDLVGRVIIAPDMIPVGVITSFIGGPMFLWLIIKKKKEVW
ncbi:MAG: iron ABC transporter permease [archaeon]|nr:iron ABC transporter permease [archaeon]